MRTKTPAPFPIAMKTNAIVSAMSAIRPSQLACTDGATKTSANASSAARPAIAISQPTRGRRAAVVVVMASSVLVCGDATPEARTRTGRHPERMTARVKTEKSKLSTQSETLDQRAVTLDVDVTEVAQQAATLANHEQTTTVGVVVVLVFLEVLGQVVDPSCEQRHLNLGGSGVTWVGCVLFDDRVLN